MKGLVDIMKQLYDSLKRCHVDTLAAMEKRDIELMDSLLCVCDHLDTVDTTHTTKKNQKDTSKLIKSINDFCFGQLDSEILAIKTKLYPTKHDELPIDDYTHLDITESMVKSLELLEVYSNNYALTTKGKFNSIKLRNQMNQYFQNLPTWYHTIADNVIIED